jgi:CBS domain-containing protein
MLVKDVMHRAVCIDPQENLAAAARKLRDEHVSCLPVCRGTHVLGVLTDCDIVVRSAAQSRDPGETKVREVMSVSALCCAQDDTIENAACLMQQSHVRRFVVLDPHSHVVGIVSANDVGVGDLGGWVSRPLPFEVVFYKEVLDHFGRPHRCELMRVPVARGTRDEAVRAATREFEEVQHLSRWDVLADGYEVISACAES